MKKIHIVALVLLVIGAFTLMNASKDVTTYANFEDAINGQNVKVAGELDREKEMVYNPDVDHEKFTFHMIDKNGVSKKVVLSKAKPQDFERSETVVVTGKLKNDVFYASDVLVKCPSKYKEEEIYLKEEMKG